MAFLDSLASFFRPIPTEIDLRAEAREAFQKSVCSLVNTANEVASDISQSRLNDQGRLSTLRDTGLIGVHEDATFDRMTVLARSIFKASQAIITLVDKEEVYILSTDPKACLPVCDPLSKHICPDVIVAGKPLVINDALKSPYAGHTAVVDRGLRAYMGVPLTVTSQIIGVLCVVDIVEREWDHDDLALLNVVCELTESAVVTYRRKNP